MALAILEAISHKNMSLVSTKIPNPLELFFLYIFAVLFHFGGLAASV